MATVIWYRLVQLLKNIFKLFSSFSYFYLFFFLFQGNKNRVNELRRYIMFQSRRHDKICEKIHKLRGQG